MAGSSDDALLTSLRNRVRTVNLLWRLAASDLAPEQVNHHERDGVLPLSFCFTHTLISQDASACHYLLGRDEPLWRSEGWNERVQLSFPVQTAYTQTGNEMPPIYPEGYAWFGVPVGTMQHLKIGDWEAWKAYQERVAEVTEQGMAALTTEGLIEVVVPTVPPDLENAFLGRLAGGRGVPIRRLDCIEGFIYSHGLRHFGEVEFARSLVGLGGVSL